MVNSFNFSLDVAVMINILQDINDVHEKMLKAINLH